MLLSSVGSKYTHPSLHNVITWLSSVSMLLFSVDSKYTRPSLHDVITCLSSVGINTAIFSR